MTRPKRATVPPRCINRNESTESSGQFRRHLQFLLGALVLIGGCRNGAPEVSGTIEADRTTAAAEMAGRLLAVHIDEGQIVEAGDLLLEFDCDVPRLQHEQAAAGVQLAQAQLDLLNDGARPQEITAAEAQIAIIEQQLEMARSGATRNQRNQLQAGIEAVEARIALAERSLERAVALTASGSAPALTADEAETQLSVLRAEKDRLTAQLREARRGARGEELEILSQQLSQANQQLEILREGARTPQVAAAEANVELARGQVALALEAVERCQVFAPVAGTVDIVDFEAGEVVGTGVPLVAIAQGDNFRVRTYAAQELLGDLAVGDALTIIVDGFESADVSGEITRIHDAPEFADGNVQTPEDRMLLVYRVDLVVTNAEDITLRPGMTVVVDFAGAP